MYRSELPGDYREWRGCYSKRRYRNRQTARRVISRMRQKRGRLNVYKCEYCGGYHCGKA